jgi:hypothetical protein
VRDGRIYLDGLSLSAAAASAEAVVFGLASDSIVVGIGSWRFRLPPWFTRRGRLLPPGSGYAAMVALGQTAAGMSLGLFPAMLGLGTGLAVGLAALTSLSGGALIMMVSVLVHEVGHVVAYRLLMGREAPAVLVTRGPSSYLVRRRGEWGKDFAVVVSGAVAPSLVGLASLPLLWHFPFLAVIAAATAAGHVIALGFPVGDGASLRELIK